VSTVSTRRAVADRPPFQELVDAHAGTVLAYLRVASGGADAEDLLQDTFLAALRTYPGFDGRSPRAWRLSIARSRVIDVARRRARRGETPLTEPDELPAAPAPDGFSGEIWDAVRRLPPAQREATVLRFGFDLRFREIGAAMDCSEDAARRSVHEAMIKLRRSPEASAARGARE
jgi:RNA polymerase sigma factor (sigma-70 family)